MIPVSILTPSFNYAQFLPDCLKSVASQTYPGIEHVVVDGGSTDGTVEVLKAAEGTPLRWISERDRGQSHALNKALRISTGDLIGWLNADDAYADIRAVERAVKVFAAFPEVGVVYGHGLLINAENRVLQFMWAPAYSESLTRRMTPFIQPSVFMRRSVLESPFVDESLQFVMDRDLWLRLLDKTRFRRVDSVIAVDRQHSLRKVMSQGFVAERDAYALRAGHSLPSLTAKLLKVAFRMIGLARVANLRQQITPAFELRFDGLPSQMLRQALIRRRDMPID
jgi:glycosyltransferase involved in cell wall biosynthesis